MRTRTALSVVLATFTAASLTILACSKDKEEEEEEGLSAEQKADGNKAASAATSKILSSASEGASLKGKEFKAQLKAMYLEAKSQKRQLLALQGEDDGGFDFDLCAGMQSYCEEKLNKAEAADLDGQTCTTTSCTGGQTESCTSPSQTAKCGAVTYTMSESTMNSKFVCSKVADKKFQFAISADFAGTLSGGTLTTGVKLECKINIAIPFDFTAASSEESESETELSCEDGQFSCSLDGEALSCAELKAAVEDKSCG